LNAVSKMRWFDAVEDGYNTIGGERVDLLCLNNLTYRGKLHDLKCKISGAQFSLV
jgi:hypothetical protein